MTLLAPSPSSTAPSTGTSFFETRGISVAFGGLNVLENVSLKVPVDGLFGLIGPNGAGKSTLFAVLSGFLRPASGQVILDGAVISRSSPQARVAAGIARTFQVPREFSHLTVRENLLAASPNHPGENLVNVFFSPGRVRAAEKVVRGKAEELMRFLNLSRVAEVPAGSLSGGQKKLLELGRVMMLDPKLVLLDEPFAGVNPVLVEEICARIADIHRGGVGFLIIEHDLPVLSRVVPELAVLDRGRIIAQGAPDAVLDQPEVREAYLGTLEGSKL